MSFVCNLCDNTFITKQRLNTHLETEKHKTVLKLHDKLNEHHITEINKLNNIINKLNEELKNNQDLIIQNIKFQDNINNLKEKVEEYRKIVEKAATKSINTFRIKDEYKQDNTFEIDINLDNKQLNKTKYKDVPEDKIKNEIQSLKLKDNYQLEHRDSDGYIDITNLCKAGGKEFKSWNRLDKTKRFLDVLSLTVKIHTIELLKQEQGGNGERHTWAHPQVAINIAQWISPEFDVLVSKWVYEIMLTGKVDIRDNKTTQELDIINKENKLLKNRIKLLESKVLQKQPRDKFEENKNVVYIVTTEYKEAQGHYKIGKAQDLQKRLSTLNTSDKHEVIYNTSCKSKKNMDLLEQIIHNKLDNKRIEPNNEWFESEEDAEDFIKVIEECKKFIDV